MKFCQNNNLYPDTENLSTTSFELTESDIVFLDNHLLIVRKPAGILVQADKADSLNLEDAAKSYLKKKFDKPGNVFATATHRLDQPVGGLVILARTSKSLARMNQLFAERKIEKIYLALVEGKPEMQKHLRHWIKKNEVTNKVWTYTYPRGDAKQADLSYWQTAADKGISMLCVRLFTGRHHQIRAQLALDKTPIVGDSKYGKKSELVETMALFSFAAAFEHPVTKERMLVKTEIPNTKIWRGFSAPDAAMLDIAFAAEIG